MSIGQAKKNYNKELDRFYKAEEYFDRKEIPQEEREKFIPNFKQILNDLNYYLCKIQKYTDDEILKGFEI